MENTAEKERLSEIINLRVTPEMKKKVSKLTDYKNATLNLGFSEQATVRHIISNDPLYANIDQVWQSYKDNSC